MKKADYIRGIKDKNIWKKAEAILLLRKYKLNGVLLPVVALPLRREKEMKEILKTIKADKSKQKPVLKDVCIARFELQKEEKTGATIAQVHTPLVGKVTMAAVFEKKGKALFKKLDYKLVVELDIQEEAVVVEDKQDTSTESSPSTSPDKKPTSPSKKLTKEQEAKVREGAQHMLGHLRSIMERIGIS